VVFSSNPDGIFNIYRYDLDTRIKEKLTNVLGGAFMPLITADEVLFYSSYQSTGYKIARKTEIRPMNDAVSYHPVLQKEGKASVRDVGALNEFDDADLAGLAPVLSRRRAEEAQTISIKTR